MTTTTLLGTLLRLLVSTLLVLHLVCVSRCRETLGLMGWYVREEGLVGSIDLGEDRMPRACIRAVREPSITSMYTYRLRLLGSTVLLLRWSAVLRLTAVILIV
jgi:hypothetical protein